MKVLDIIFPVGIGMIVALGLSFAYFQLNPDRFEGESAFQKRITAEGILTDFDVYPTSIRGGGMAKFTIGDQTILSKGDVKIQLITGKCYVLYEGQSVWGNIQIEECKI